MKKILKISLIILTLAGIIAILLILNMQTENRRRTVTCSGLKIEVLDSARLGFVTKSDVKNIIDSEYGTYSGQRIDSVKLRKIESILDGKSAIYKSQAYVTNDGILHVEVTQREPVIKFVTKNGGFYADETGFLFPLRSDYKANVPTIEGNIPLNVSNGYKGVAKTVKEKAWLDGVIEMMNFINSDKSWSGGIVNISVDANGDLILTPGQGREKFIFGKPDNIEDKFARMEKYYRYIAPSKSEGYYATVNVKYSKQIICRK